MERKRGYHSMLAILGLGCVASTAEIYFPAVLEAVKSKIEDLADSVSREDSLCGLSSAHE